MIKNRYTFWAKNKRIRQNYITFYPETLNSNLYKLESGIQLLPMNQCSHIFSGVCLNDKCNSLHGKLCDWCGTYSLDPFCEEQRKKHLEVCEKEFIFDMDRAFFIQNQSDEICSICFDVVMEKELPSERKFGILENCYHVFCYICIKKWREKSNITDSDLQLSNASKACPVCREPSKDMVSSRIWFEDDEKKKQFMEYKKLYFKTIPCKYFKNGKKCIFKEQCRYSHMNLDTDSSTGKEIECAPYEFH